jgi:hypothetical protein
MTNQIKIKRSATSASTTLAFGELAFSDLGTGLVVLGGDASGVTRVIGGIGKMNTVTGATAGNLLNVNASGQATDSTYAVETTLTGSATKIPSSLAVQNVINAALQGLDQKQSVSAVTNAPLPTVTASGTGVGKTLTATANGLLVVDGFSAWFDVNTDGGSTNPESTTTRPASRVIVKNEVAQGNNGIYCVTSKGSASTPFVLTRAIDADTGLKLSQVAYAFTDGGTANLNTGWRLTTPDPIVVDTSNLVFALFSGAGIITAGNGLTKTGAVISALQDITTVSANTAQAVQVLATGLSVFVDNSTMTGSGATQLSVKAGGITATQIATATITTTQISATAGITGGQLASSIALAGSPTTTTQAPGTSSTAIATTAFTTNAVNTAAFETVQTINASSSITNWMTLALVSGAISVTLPAIAGNTGKRVRIKKTDSGTSTTILPATGTLDGLASIILTNLNDEITVTTDGSTYYVVGSYEAILDGGTF